MSREAVYLLTDLVLFGKEQKKRVSLGFGQIDKNKAHHKIVETMLISEQVLESTKILETCDFPGVGPVQYVLQLDSVFVHIGDKEKLNRWDRLIREVF